MVVVVKAVAAVVVEVVSVTVGTTVAVRVW